MCMIDDCEPVQTLTEPVTRKARKAHICDECRRTIAPGESYEYTSFTCEGEFMEHKLCDRCGVPRQWLQKNCGGFVYHMVAEEIIEHAREYRALARPLYRIAVGMERKWQRFDGRGLMPIPKQAPNISVAEVARG